jgi:hypothetical protein
METILALTSMKANDSNTFQQEMCVRGLERASMDVECCKDLTCELAVDLGW